MFNYRDNGFTLVEMIVVIGLMTILLVFALSNLNNNRAGARDNIRVSDIKRIRLALEEYHVHCGVFPSTLDISTNNARNGVCSSRLGDFISEIPNNPSYSLKPSYIHTQYYQYVGLSKVPGGPCYDYHLAVQLERGGDDNDYSGDKNARYFNEDHDFAKNSGRYGEECAGASFADIIEHAEDDDNYGLYDFRNSNSE